MDKAKRKHDSAAGVRASTMCALMCATLPEAAAAAETAPEQPPFVVVDLGSSSGSDDRARARAFAARGVEQPPLSLKRGGGSTETLLHLGSSYLPFRYKSGGEVVAYVHADTQSIHSAFAMRAAQAYGTKPEARTQGTNRERYAIVDVTVALRTAKRLLVHRLLVAASLGVSYEALIGLEVDHKNGMRGDNTTITNLQLLTKAAHKAKTARTTVERNRAARAASAKRAESTVSDAAADSEAAADAEAGAGAPPSTAPHTHSRVHGSARPVVRTSKDGATTLFASTTAAAASVGGAHPRISEACTADREAYGFTWRYTDTPEVSALLGAADKREAATQGTGWRNLVLPDGTNVPGYRISYNLVVRSPSGAHFLGNSIEGGRARAFRFQRKDYKTYALGCASWYGPRPTDAVVLHANDCYDNVTVEGLSWGTQKQNMTEAHGRPVSVTNAAGVWTYPSWGGAAERLGMSANALKHRMRLSSYQSVQVKDCTVTCGPTRKRRRDT